MFISARKMKQGRQIERNRGIMAILEKVVRKNILVREHLPLAQRNWGNKS